MRKRGSRIHSSLGLAYIFRVMLDREYRLGGDGKTIGEPFDCFGMIVEYLKLRYKYDILQISSEYCDDYVAYYKISKEVIFSILKTLLGDTLLNIVPVYKMPGDIIYARADNQVSVGVYGGNGVLMISSERTGCVSIGINFYEIESVYRWPLLFQ